MHQTQEKYQQTIATMSEKHAQAQVEMEALYSDFLTKWQEKTASKVSEYKEAIKELIFNSTQKEESAKEADLRITKLEIALKSAESQNSQLRGQMLESERVFEDKIIEMEREMEKIRE